MNALAAVSLVAAARAALQTATAIDSRRAGRDPSEQEPEGAVREDLGGLRATLAEHVARLRLRAAVGAPEGVGETARAFEDRVLLDDVGRTLAVVHQKLLSLFPAVDAALVEAVRRTAAEARARALADDPDAGLDAFAADVSDLADALADAL